MAYDPQGFFKQKEELLKRTNRPSSIIIQTLCVCVTTQLLPWEGSLLFQNRK